jgi:hypothetical protein
MKYRYSIWGREWGADHDVEIVSVNSNPEAMRKALGMKTLMVNRSILPGGKKSKTAKYSYLRIVENVDADSGNEPNRS